MNSYPSPTLALPYAYPRPTLQEEEAEEEKEGTRKRIKKRIRTIIVGNDALTLARLKPFPRLHNWYRSTVPEVSLSVCIGADSIWLASIEVDHDYRHQGIGTTIINHLKALADRLSLPLCLTPTGETPEWQLCLEAWYASLGFVWQGELMVRFPNSEGRN